MLKKIDKGAQFLRGSHSAFRCPFCHHEFNPLEGYSLTCVNGHRFDLSKKGTLYFLKHAIQTEYNQKMLAHRRAIINSGMYQPMLALINEWAEVEDEQLVVDVGCGEGSFLQQLTDLGLDGKKIGFDISKEGIYLATDQPASAFWCVADLTNLPFQSASVDLLLNIFSPSHYQEFQRVLTKGGEVIKVVPESGYLTELRQAFYPEDTTKQHYSNKPVVEKFKEKLTLTQQERVTYRFVLPEAVRLDLLEMSPLEWGVSEERKAIVRQNPPSEITIDVRILKGSN